MPQYPHYGQWSQNSCGVECVRMALETLLGRTVQRQRVKARLEQAGAYWVGNAHMAGGALFHAIGGAFEPGGAIAYVLRVSTAPNDLVGALRGSNQVALVECLNGGLGHCIVVDLSFVQNGQHVFQVRDPARQGMEPAVPATDPRIAGQHRYWLLSS